MDEALHILLHRYIHSSTVSSLFNTGTQVFHVTDHKVKSMRGPFWVNVRWGPGGGNRMADKVPLVIELLPLKPTKPLDYCAGLRQIAMLFSIHYSATSNYQELNVYHWWLSIVCESYLVQWI